MAVSVNASELNSNAILTRVDRTRVNWYYVPPRKPTPDKSIESLNGRLRDELLDETL
jgi:putative transposase